MEITEKQKRILEQYTCERLSANPENRGLLERFTSDRGSNLVAYLRQYGWDEDVSGETAFYLIKDADGEPCLFFSLKCGALFQPLQESEIQDIIEKSQGVLDLLQATQGDSLSQEKILNELERYRVTHRITVSQDAYAQLILTQLQKNVARHRKMLRQLNEDKRREGNRPIQRVLATFPGVEMVHFCANDAAKTKWKTYGFPTSMGETLFWWSIVPAFERIQALVGCQYAFIFAADETVDGTLTNYYTVSLKFSKLPDIGTAKPRYDYCCDFMSQEVNEMRRHRIEFFAGFNPDPEDIFV